MLLQYKEMQIRVNVGNINFSIRTTIKGRKNSAIKAIESSILS